MKRTGAVFEEVLSFPVLCDAAHRVFRANRNNADKLQFMYRLEPELFQLQRELESGTYLPGAYHTFTIREPKERRVKV